MQIDADNGIYVGPTPITAGEDVEIKYNGLLARSGAQEVYLHAGFGINDQWDRVKDVKMHKIRDEWQTDMKVDTNSRLNLCFHDNADNWDNNNGKNWSFEVHNGNLY